MITKEQIKENLSKLNNKLKAIDRKGEICLYGGAVMCLVFDARPSTKDVDAVFKPTQIIRQAIQEIALENNLSEDWLNDSVKGFLVQHNQRILFSWSHLNVYTPEPDYLLAMKTLAARVDTKDRTDVEFLIEKLGLVSAEEVFKILEGYYPKKQIKPATQFFIEELFENDSVE